MDLRLKPENGTSSTTTANNTSDTFSRRRGGRQQHTALLDDTEERYDSCGAMDLSSSCSGSALEDNDQQPQPSKALTPSRRKRKACDSDGEEEGQAPNGEHQTHVNGVVDGKDEPQLLPPKRKDVDGQNHQHTTANSNGVSCVGGAGGGVVVGNNTPSKEPKVRNTRKNIKEVMSVSQLNSQTKEAQAAEQMRLNRLQELKASQQKHKGEFNLKIPY